MAAKRSGQRKGVRQRRFKPRREVVRPQESRLIVGLRLEDDSVGVVGAAGIYDSTTSAAGADRHGARAAAAMPSKMLIVAYTIACAHPKQLRCCVIIYL